MLRTDHAFQPARRVDVPIGGQVALVPHQLLQLVARQRRRVHCGEGAAKVVEPVQVAGFIVAEVVIVSHYLAPLIGSYRSC